MQNQGRKQPPPPSSQQQTETQSVSVVEVSDFSSEAFIQQLPSEIREKVSLFDKQLNNLENFLKPLYQFNNLKQLCQDLEPLERAKVNMSLAYTINTLFYMYLKTQGVNPQKHPVKKELERIQLYMKKIKQKQEELVGKSTQPKTEQKPTLSLDKEAAKRIISSALNAKTDDDEEMTDNSGKENMQPQKDDDTTPIAEKKTTSDSSNKKRKSDVVPKQQPPQQKKRK